MLCDENDSEMEIEEVLNIFLPVSIMPDMSSTPWPSSIFKLLIPSSTQNASNDAVES